MDSVRRAPDPPTSSTPPPTDDIVDAVAPLQQEEHQQQLHGDNQSESGGSNRHPSWLPEDQHYLKGAAVGPSDSMLVTAGDVPVRTNQQQQQQQQQTLSAMTPTTACTSQDGSNPGNLVIVHLAEEGRITIPSPLSAGDNGAITARLVEQGQIGSAHAAPPPSALQCVPNLDTPGGKLFFVIVTVLAVTLWVYRVMSYIRKAQQQ
jgi:hypothetical protein